MGFLALNSRSTDGSLSFTHIVYAHAGAVDVNVLSQRALPDGGLDEMGSKTQPVDVPFAGAWHEVVVDLYDDVSGKRISTSFDGKVTLAYPLTPDFELQDPGLAIGPFCADADAGAVHEFDDVAFWTD